LIGLTTSRPPGSGPSIRKRRLPRDVELHTGWLSQEGYIKSFGSHPSERVTLATKGLIAMNAVPSGLKTPLGAELSKVAEGPNINTSAIGDFLGGLFGGLTKSLGSS
jgi:hypothetical protein